MNMLDNLRIKSNERTSLLEFSDFGQLPVILLSLDFKILDYNKTAEKIYQWKREDVLNKSYLTWCKNNHVSVPITIDDKGKLLEKIPLLNVENDIYDGKYVIRWNIIPNFDENNCLNEIVLIGTDITLQKSFENQMQRLADVSKAMIGYDIGSHRMAEEYVSSVYAYLEKIISWLPCIVFWKDKNLVYVSCNDLSLKLLNRKSRDEVIGKTDFDLGIDFNTAHEIRKVDEEIIRTKLPKLNEEHHLNLVDGRKYVYLLSKVPILDEFGEVVGIAGIMVDITEHKKNERELIKAKEGAEAANKLKTEFVRNLEHDIRTPFSGILGMTKILSKMEKDPNKKQIIQDISSCTQELLDYCSSVLNFSKVESETFPVIDKKFSLKQLLNRIVVLETPVAKLKNINFSVEYDETIPDNLMGDSYRLERILINLVSNAIKFTQKGFIRVITKKINIINFREIIISFAIEDSGIGIASDKLDIVFEKFYRVSPAHKGAYKGHGLGLHIVKQFVQEMGGDIDIESTLGQGSRFICTLPFKIPLNEKLQNTDSSDLQPK